MAGGERLVLTMDVETMDVETWLKTVANIDAVAFLPVLRCFTPP